MASTSSETHETPRWVATEEDGRTTTVTPQTEKYGSRRFWLKQILNCEWGKFPGPPRASRRSKVGDSWFSEPWHADWQHTCCVDAQELARPLSGKTWVLDVSVDHLEAKVGSDHAPEFRDFSLAVAQRGNQKRVIRPESHQKSPIIQNFKSLDT